jgi:hypothetical protein
LVRAKGEEGARCHPGVVPSEERLSTTPDPIDPLFGREEHLEAYIPWSQLMKRVHGIDVLQCPCGGQRKVIRYLTESDKIREELERLGLWSQEPKVDKARRPPQALLFDQSTNADGVDPPCPDWVA